MGKVKLYRIHTETGLRLVVGLINRFSGLLSRKTSSSMAGKTFFCVMVDGEVVGVAGYRPLNSWVAEQIHTIILPKHRGNGYGREASSLMTEMLLRKYGKVFCTVNENNEPMVRIKNSMGFETEGVLKDHYAKGRNIIVFSRRRK